MMEGTLELSSVDIWCILEDNKELEVGKGVYDARVKKGIMLMRAYNQYNIVPEPYGRVQMKQKGLNHIKKMSMF